MDGPNDRPIAKAGMVWMPYQYVSARWVSPAAVEHITPGTAFGADDSWCYVDGERVDVSSAAMLEVLAEAWRQRGVG